MGGWAGSINCVSRDSAVDRDLASAIQQGYATASTDTGHTGRGAAFAAEHPEKLIDFAYRAVHEMVLQSKTIIAAFYGQDPRYSYWNGCSAGGGQGFMEAWRYSRDFDGILAGVAGNPLNMALEYSWISIAQAVHRTPDSFIPSSKFALLHDAAVKFCDSADGLKDGLIQDPTLCQFHPKIVECKGTDAPDCLTQAQVNAAWQIYSPARYLDTKKIIYPGLEPGSELGWAVLAGETAAPFATDFFKYIIFKDPAWDFRSLRFDSQSKLPNEIPPGFNPMNPNLKSYFARHGRLLLYHGWSDPLAAPRGSVEYYKRVLKTVGSSSKTMDSLRLFMAPGMAHCGGGDGPNKFDAMSALATWVEKGKAPESIVASHSTNGKVDRTRPLCPYPQVARYKSSGNIDDAANFVCRTP